VFENRLRNVAGQGTLNDDRNSRTATPKLVQYTKQIQGRELIGGNHQSAGLQLLNCINRAVRLVA